MEEYWAITTLVYGGWVSGLGRKKVRYFRKHRAGSMNGLILIWFNGTSAQCELEHIITLVTVGGREFHHPGSASHHPGYSGRLGIPSP